MPSIAIATSEHVPCWDGEDGYDFNADEIVPWLEKDGPNWRQRGFLDGEWSVGYYRSRTAGSQVRIEKWVHRPTGRVHFRTRDARDVLTIYGARPASAARLADPDDTNRTFMWLPELQMDPVGNAVWVEYQPETLDGADGSAPSEQGRPTPAQRYLKRIRYGNASPFGLTDEVVNGVVPSDVRWCFQLVFDYGDHADPELPAADPDRAWPARADVFSNCRAGFEVRTYRLCGRILAFHDFTELGPGPTLVGALVLKHDQDPAGSTLREISWIGHRLDGGAHASRALPPLRMTYATAGISGTFSPAPAETQQNVPGGLAGRHLFVDLAGDGLPGILAETERAWFYKSNEGDGRFGAQAMVLERPATRPGSFAFGDVDRDGDLELAMLAGRMAGVFERDREAGRWEGFRPFPAMPHVEALGGHAQWVDLNGDGRPDIVIPHGDRLTWFPSQGESFGDPVEVPLPRSRTAAPTVVEDRMLDLVFADMNGDGLVDLAQVRDGRVEYWPSLGNGRFGQGVVLDGSPVFDQYGHFDSGRVRFVDLDGSGTMDILYLGRGEVSVWINAAGNRLVPGPRLRGLPYLDNLSSVSILDFLGDGRPSLVWSSPLPGRASPLQYLKLTSPEHPRLLLSADDSLGRETRFTYSSSARHYLRDKRAGFPWLTRLPSHVTVVDRREVVDHIGGTRSVQRFEYRDGCFDGEVQEFRGFGRVDMYDAETTDERLPPAPHAPVAAPPLLTRMWFHHGIGSRIGAALDGTYVGDSHLPELPPHVIEDTHLPSDVIGDAERAVAGRLVHVERYAIDSDGSSVATPFDVSQSSFRVRRIQPAVGRSRAAFVVVPHETITAHYDGIADDPRVTHHVVVDVDAFDVVVREAEISYARRPGHAREIPAQGETQIVVSDHAFIHFDTPQRFELGLPIEGRDIELLGVGPELAGRITRARLRQADIIAALAAPRHHHEVVPPGLGARLLNWERSEYWNDERTDVLPHGEIGRVALIHHEEASCFAPELIREIFGERVNDARLVTLGYFERDGLWWRRDETHFFGGAPLFFQRQAVEEVDGGRTELEYDAYAIEVTAQTDAAGNRLVGIIDYHIPAPWSLTDANGTITEVRYDALGVVVASTSRGHVEGKPWGFDALATIDARTPSDAAALIAGPERYLQGAKSFVWYDLETWSRDRMPSIVITLLQEKLRHDGRRGGDPIGRIAIEVAHLDGLGRTLQSKTLVEPGQSIQRDANGDVVVDGAGHVVLAPAAQRWEVSGHVVYDEKQRPRQQYEPYFSPSWAYESDAVLDQLGVATLTLQDAIGREVGRLLPSGTFTSTIYRPWSIEHADANDNVLGSVYHATRDGLPASDPEKEALEHAKMHAGTSVVAFLDGAGREVGRVEHGGATSDDRRIESRLDGSGNLLALIDPRGLAAFTYRRDMDGRLLFVHSVDAGDTSTLLDSQDRLVQTWDPRGVEIEHRYDGLGRPTTTHVRGMGLDHRVEERSYGEALPDGAARNLRGRLARERDAAGQITTDACDPIGRVISSTRRFRTDTGQEPDWRSPITLDEETFTSTVEYDAVGRPRQVEQPDGSVRRITYRRNGGVQRETVTTPDGELVDALIVDDAAYDAHRRRSRTLLGNGVDITYTYDAETQQLSTQTACRGSRTYQNVEYTHDPVGNLVRITDHAQEGAGALISGTILPARRQYRYDAHYRLTCATGRVHQALLQHDHIPDGGGFKGTRHITLNNGAALEAFTRRFDYDASGNLLRIRHQGRTRSWTTDMWVSPTSNRSLPALAPNGGAVVDPEAKFDRSGRITQLDHLRRMEWSWRGTLTRAVIIERAGRTDDDESYVYGADGLRLRKITTTVVGEGLKVTEKTYLGSCERKRIRLGGEVIFERWTSSFMDAVDGQRIALLHRWVRDDLRLEANESTQTRIHYQVPTPQGSSAIEIAQNGDLISYEEYFPYGGSSFVAGDAVRDVSPKDYRYSGKERDDQTGFYYYGYRYYAPWMGRWLSPDPLGPEDDLNLYQFVFGDPVGNVDPDGLQTSLPEGDVVPLASVAGGLSERQARAQFNAGRGIELGIQATRLRSLGDGNWLIVSYTRIPPSVLPYAQQFHSVAIGGLLAQLDEELETIDAMQAIQEGSARTEDDDNRQGNLDGVQDNPGNGQNGSGGQQTPSPPGSGATAGNDANGGGREGNASSAPNAARPGPGSGDKGQRTGNGPTASNGTGGRPRHGRRETRAGGTGDTGVSTGNPNGSPEGVEQGSPNGVPAGGIDAVGTNPSQSGTGTPAVDTTGNESGTGTNTGGTSEQGLGGSATGQTVSGVGRRNSDRQAGGTDPGLPDGQREPSANGTSHDGSGQAAYEENVLDVLTRWAGYLNLEFGGGSGSGRRGGIPGGSGTHNLGWIGQVGYIALTILSLIGPGKIFTGLRFGIRLATRGVSALRAAAVPLLRRLVGLFARRAAPGMVLRSQRLAPWRAGFGRITTEGYGRLIRDLPRGHEYRNRLARMIRQIRRSGGAAGRRPGGLGNVVAEHLVPEGAPPISVFRYDPTKLRIADLVEELTHWQQIQRGMRARGYSVETLEILAKKRVLQLPGLSNELRREFQHDINLVKLGKYVQSMP